MSKALYNPQERGGVLKKGHQMVSLWCERLMHIHSACKYKNVLSLAKNKISWTQKSGKQTKTEYDILLKY